MPCTPFRVLDAPHLRDDFYCSALAYSSTSRTLAVGLNQRVYLWSETGGVQYPPLTRSRFSHHVTSVSFSSTEGGHSILAVGRQGGQLSLWSSLEAETRFEIKHTSPVTCVSFKPMVTYRPSHYFDQNASCEDLLVGDEHGFIYFYSIEWPSSAQLCNHPNWTGNVAVLAKVAAHSQQICGLAWSPDGKYFATGGNDNVALLFESATVLGRGKNSRGRYERRNVHPTDPVVTNLSPPTSPTAIDPEAFDLWTRLRTSNRSAANLMPWRTRPGHLDHAATPHVTGTPPPVPPRSPVSGLLTPPTSPTRLQQYTPESQSHPTHWNMHKHHFTHSAAVKALAFAPWQSSLLATGGGSNDRQIHFFHTTSGATLALINVWAQVTSLIWSTTKREICATFGYAQPEHRVRIAVFAWPSAECVVSIPWGGERENNNLRSNVGLGGDGGRALWAIAFPGGPNPSGRSDSRSPGRGHGGTGPGTGTGTERREGERWASRTEEEGCIIVAGSDESVKFHEVWAGKSRGGQGIACEALGLTRGALGGSAILEGVCEGIDVEGIEVIR